MAAPLGAKMGDAYVTVSVDASQVGPELEAKVDVALAGVVEAADGAMAEVGAAAERAGVQIGQAFETASKAQQESFLKAQAAAENASARVVAAKNTEAEATSRVAAAEAALAEARAAGSDEAIAEATANLARSRGQLEVATAKVSGAEATATVTTAQLSAATAELGATEEATAAKATAAAGTISSKWGAMAGLVGGATAVVLVKTAGDYQQQLTKLSTTAGESVGNLKMVGDGMLAMAGQVGIGAQHLSEGMYTVESAGFHGADGLTVLRAAAQGAKQENADLEKVTDAVTTALHDYNMPASDAALVTSQLVDAVAHGKTTFDALTGSMHSVTPLAASMHMSLAETAGALSAMTASGMSADQASQNLADALRHLQSPTQPMINQLAQLGIRATDLSANLGKKGLAGTMQEIEGAIVEHLDPATKKVLLPALNKSKEAAADLHTMIGAMPGGLAKLSQGLLDGSTDITTYTKAVKGMGGPAGAMGTQFLSLYKNSDGFSQILKSGSPAAQTFTAALQKSVGTSAGLSVALQLTGEHAAATNAAIKDIAHAVPEADGSIRGWSEVQGNFNQQLSETWAGIKSWAIQMGQQLLPAATKVIAVVRELVDWLSKHSTVVKVLAGVVGGFLGMLLVYKTTVGLLALGEKAWALATGIATAAQRLLGIATEETNVAMELNPIGLIVTLLAALVIGVIYAWNHFKWFKDAIEACWHGLKVAGEWIGHVAEAVWTALGKALDWVKGHWPLLLEIISGPIGWIIALITNFGPQLLHLFSKAWNAVTGWLTGTAGPALAHFFEELPGRIGRGLLTALKAVANFIGEVVVFFVTLPVKIVATLVVLGVKIGEAFYHAFEYLKTNIPIWIGNVIRFFEELPGKALHALESLREKLHDAIWTAIDWVRDHMTEWIGNILHFFEELPGKVGDALLSLRDKLHDAIWAAIDWAKNAAKDGVENIISFFAKLPGRIKDLGGDMLEAGKHLIGSMIDGIVNAAHWVGDIGKKVVNTIIGWINDHIIDGINSHLDFHVMGVHIDLPDIPHIPMLAQGGVIDRPTLAIVGEDGPEAVVPLSKPGRAGQVMAAAGLGGGGAGGTTVNLTQNLTVPKQATAAQAAALFEQKLTRDLALGATRSDMLAALGGVA